MEHFTGERGWDTAIKKTFTSREANEIKRDSYQELIKDIPLDKRVYRDESGSEVGRGKDHGGSKIGKRLRAKKRGKYSHRTTIVAGLVNNRAIAPLVFKGSGTRKLCEGGVKQFLLKE